MGYWLQPTGLDAAVRIINAVRREKGCVDAEKHKRAKDSTVKRGDMVLLWQRRQSKFSTQFERPLLHSGPQKTLSHSGKGWQVDDASCVICGALGSACTRDSFANLHG